MTFVYMGAAIAFLAAALFLAVRAWLGGRKEAAEKNAVIEQQKAAIEKRDKYLEQWEAIRNETEKKKAQLHTGNPDADFNSSVGLLHDLAGGKKPPA
jgi:hypothetical protein